jgi:hypothetical protein
MATHTITIYATNANPLPLSISDDEGHTASTHDDDANLTTEFINGDTIRFEISTNAGCNIASISAINITDLTDGNGNSYNLFSTLPAPAGDGTTAWSGVVGVPSHPPTETYESAAESYTISFTMTDGTNHTEDPRLKIKQ